MTEPTAPLRGFADREAFTDLVRKGAPLYLGALQLTSIPEAVEDTLTPEMRQAAQHTRAASMAIQALLAGSPLDMGGCMVVLGAAAGALLAQCPLERYQALYDMFQSQFSATLANASLALRDRIDG